MRSTDERRQTKADTDESVVIELFSVADIFFKFKYFLLQIFHGVWTIAFFVLTLVNAKTVLPNASCLLAGYLPATTVLHILLIPSDYPLPVSSNIFHLSRYCCWNVFQTPRLLCCNHGKLNCV